MKILVVGGGGREHSLVWKLAQSPSNPEIICVPGNAGIAKIATCVDIGASDVDALVDYAEAHSFDLTLVGPEGPLCAGIVDEFSRRGLTVFGPSAAAAALEGDKSFSKDIMVRNSIPTANHHTFGDVESARHYVEQTVDYPLVVKASGLAAGKGVIICADSDEALKAVDEIMVENRFGAAGDCLVIEDFLEGEEVSVIAITDGNTICVLESSQDHKRAFDGDEGPNTGGMGAYSPASIMTPELQTVVEESVLVPIVHAMGRAGRPFKGVLYAGLMVTPKGVRVLEFNVRFGDPECQVLMVRMQCDLVEVLKLCIEERLHEAVIDWDKRPAVTVVMAQEGYPGAVPGGAIIGGLDGLDGDDVIVFHAGTRQADGGIVAAGGRVLNVTAVGEDLRDALDKAYGTIEKIEFPGSFFRRDIGARALSAPVEP